MAGPGLASLPRRVSSFPQGPQAEMVFPLPTAPLHSRRYQGEKQAHLEPLPRGWTGAFLTLLKRKARWHQRPRHLLWWPGQSTLSLSTQPHPPWWVGTEITLGISGCVPQKWESLVIRGSARVLLHISGTVITEKAHAVVWQPAARHTEAVVKMVSPSPNVTRTRCWSPRPQLCCASPALSSPWRQTSLDIDSWACRVTRRPRKDGVGPKWLESHPPREL